MTSSDGGLQSCRRQDNRSGGAGVAGQNLPIIMATGCRMPRSPSRDKELSSRTAAAAAAHQQQQPFATTAVVLNRVTSSYPEAFFKSELAVEWKANSKAWMTTHIMTDWLQRLDQQMKTENRKVLFEPLEMENEVNENELIELMELLPLPRYDDFAIIDSNLPTECSSDDIAIILNDIQTELNPVEVDDEEQAKNQLENSEIKTFENYSEALEQLIRLKEFYLNKGDEKGFSNMSELIIHHELEITRSKMSQDITNSVWFEEENDLIKSCGALQSALGLSKSFSTSDIADATNMDTGCWLADADDVRMPHSASELAINKLRINSDVLLMATTMQGRLGNTSRSLSTCVVVGDMASTSQLPSPSRYSSSLHNSYAPSAFSPTDLVRSVNKKVRQNYIQRRLLITYKTLERLSLSEFNLDKSSGADRVPDQPQLSDRNDATTATAAASSGKYLSVPKTGGKPLCQDDIAVCTDTIKRYQPKAFTRYDRNMFIVNWLDNIDPQHTAAEDQ
ncbi:hypothetical protein AGLY_009181 [Aphis glycines]|uniref:DDE-1 domain-containing protein n=1 Tax=Aphis glycines TaxID=307491 RepID=A0A6G0TIN3_APHGL|nr:hypothetical protein AGLY_009181 [Aphis glycines]